MATRAKYTRSKPNEENNEAKLDTDILMRFSPTYGKYISRALTLFFGESKSFVTIKAAEKLMDKALWVAQVVRRKVEGLHMIVNVSERKVVDVWEPREEGLLTVKQERFLTILEVTLTKSPTAQQKKHAGYHVPLDIKADYLTKESWQKGQQERAEARKNRDERGGQRREKRQPREDRGNRQERPRRNRDQAEQRGGQRRRGRNNRQ